MFIRLATWARNDSPSSLIGPILSTANDNYNYNNCNYNTNKNEVYIPESANQSRVYVGRWLMYTVDKMSSPIHFPLNRPRFWPSIWRTNIRFEYVCKIRRDYLAKCDIWDKNCYTKSHVAFRLAYLHLTFAYFNGKGQGHAHFDCGYLANGDK